MIVNLSANASTPATHFGLGLRPNNRRVFSVIGLGLALIGAVVVGLSINSALQPEAAPYERVTSPVEASSYAEFGLPSERVEKAEVRRIEWRAPGIRGPVASALVARDADDRAVALDWQNFVTEPVLASDLSVKEVANVLAAIGKHVPASATVFSWWDLSRKIRFVSQRNAPLDDPLSRGLQIPSAWSQSAELVQSDERSYWGKNVPASKEATFTQFIDALLMDEATGAQALRALASNHDAYIAVHLSDIWKAAAVKPDRIGIAYRDFPSAGQSHGVIKAARQWMEENKFSGPYTVEPIGSAVRLHYLTKSDNANMLLAQLLPFSTSNPMLLKDFELVYQHRGFWIYKLRPASKSVSQN